MHEGVTTQELLTDIRNIDLEIPQFSELGTRDPIRGNYRGLYNGVPVELRVTHFSYDKDEYETSLLLSHASGVGARIIIILVKNKEGYLGMTEVDNFDSPDPGKKERVLKGAGRALWEFAPKVMQKYANTLNKEVRHLVIKDPDPSLSPEKWDKLFIPLLEKHGYKKWDGDNYHWEKTYLPQPGQ